MNHRDAAEFDELFQRVTTLETLLEHTLTLGAKLHERVDKLEQADGKVCQHTLIVHARAGSDRLICGGCGKIMNDDPTPTWTLEFAEHDDPHGWTYLNCTAFEAGVVLGTATLSHPTQVITYPEIARHHRLTAARMAIADAIDNKTGTP